MELQNLKQIKQYSIIDSTNIQKIVLKLLKCGKKQQILNILTQILQNLKKTAKAQRTFLTLLNTAIINLYPFVQLRNFKKGTTVLQIPATLSKKQQLNIAITWLIKATHQRSDVQFYTKLLKELQDITKYQGSAIQTKIEHHKIALNQKRFLYFRK
jgi:ribosomal protein S7